MADRFEIRLAEEGESDFFALQPEERRRVRDVIEGIAEVAALSPPVFPEWFKRYGMNAPVLRIHVSGYRVFYELDCEHRAIRLCRIEPVLVPAAAAY